MLRGAGRAWGLGLTAPSQAASAHGRKHAARLRGRAWGSGLTAPSPTALSSWPACTLSCSSSSAKHAAAVRAALALHPEHKGEVRPRKQFQSLMSACAGRQGLQLRLHCERLE